MANTVIALKKSATPSAAPSNLANGEIAINYADGVLYYKNAAGYIAQITSGSTGDYFGTVNANGTLVIADTTGDVFSLISGNNISIVGDAINDNITVALKDDVTIPGLLTIGAAGGDEGGEIKLANAITNSVLSGKVVIDVYQNKLRFFEEAGTNRGAFINLASASAGVGSDLLAGASAIDSTARNAASAAFDKANSSNIVATSAYDKANAANIFAFQIEGAVSGLNTTVTIANTAYDKANAANLLAFQGNANAIFANTIAILAYDKANGANLLAFQGNANAIFANTIAILAYDKANSANVLAFQANANAIFANTVSRLAYDKANSANILAFQVGGALSGLNTWISTVNTNIGTAFNKANSANYYAYLVDINAKSAFVATNAAIYNITTETSQSRLINGLPDAGDHVRTTNTSAVTVTIAADVSDSANIAAILDFNGTNNSTLIIDDSIYGTQFYTINQAKLQDQVKKFGDTALELDGTTDYVTTGDSSLWNFGSGQFTIEGWFNFRTKTSSQAMVGQWGTTTPTSSWFFYIDNDSKLKLRLVNSSTLYDLAYSWTPTLGQWYHLAATRDSAGNTRMFIDGTMVAYGTNQNIAPNDVTANLTIGAIGTTNGFAGWDYNGYIDGIRIIKGSAIYPSNSSFSVPTTDFYPPFPVGGTIAFEQTNTGTITLSPATGVTLLTPANSTATTRSANSVIYARKVATNNWVAFGDIGPDIAVSAFNKANNALANINGVVLAGSLGLDTPITFIDTIYGGLEVGANNKEGLVRFNNSANTLAGEVLGSTLGMDFAAKGNAYIYTNNIDNSSYYNEIDLIPYDEGNGGGTTGILFRVNDPNVGGEDRKMRIDAYGNVTIGRGLVASDVGQGVKLDVVGSVNAAGFLINGSPISFDLTPANNWANIVVLTANTIANLAYDKANAANILAYDTGIGANSYANATFVKLTSPSQTITGDITVAGNLIVSGNTVAYSANNLVVNDPLIILANNNISDALDIGFVGHYQNTNGYNVHTGFFRDHESKTYYLFNDYDQEPGGINHIGAFSNNMTLAVLNADLITSNLTLAGINAVVTLQSAYDKANAANLLVYQISGAITGLNTNVIIANTAYDKANAANYYAYLIDANTKAAFDKANTGGSGGASVNVGNTQPTGNTNGDLWWNTDTGRLLIYYQDIDSVQWVDATPVGDPGPKGNTGNIQIGNTTLTAPLTDPTVTNSGNGSFAILEITLPRSPNVISNNTITVAPRQIANVNSFYLANNDIGLDFYLPRVSNIYSNNVITIAPRATPNANVFYYTNNDVAIDFYFPRNSNIYSNNVIAVAPSQTPNANVFFYSNNDIAIDFYLPRAPNVLVGATTGGSPSSTPITTLNTRANGDVSIDFSIPRAANVIANNTISVQPKQAPNANSIVLANGDIALNLFLPRQSNIYSNNVITIAPRATPNANVFYYTNNDVAIDFYFPRSSNIYGNNVIAVAPSQTPNANVFFYSNNDIAIDFYLPRAPNVLVGSTTTGAPGSVSIVSGTTRANGDVSLDFTIPRGNDSVTVLSDDATTARYIVFADATSGTLARANVNTNFRFIASNGRLDLTTVNAATLLINGTEPVYGSTIVNDTVSATRYLVFANSTSGTLTQANVSVGLTFNPSTNTLSVNGSFAAQTKSFVINHPSKPGMKLQYASLEGPENGVYVRGKCEGNEIELPYYWKDLVDENSITVDLTPIGKAQSLYVKKIENNVVHIASESKTPPHCYYVIYGERKDVVKLIVEY